MPSWNKSHWHQLSLKLLCSDATSGGPPSPNNISEPPFWRTCALTTCRASCSPLGPPSYLGSSLFCQQGRKLEQRLTHYLQNRPAWNQARGLFVFVRVKTCKLCHGNGPMIIKLDIDKVPVRCSAPVCLVCFTIALP